MAVRIDQVALVFSPRVGRSRPRCCELGSRIETFLLWAVHHRLFFILFRHSWA